MKPWIKIPPEHHALFEAALPAGAESKKMFGGLCAMVNGQMACGIFGRGFLAKLSPDDQARALAIRGAEPFDPMGGRPMKDTVLFPESVFVEPAELRAWLAKAVAYTKSLPEKKAKPAKKAAKKAAKKTGGAR